MIQEIISEYMNHGYIYSELRYKAGFTQDELAQKLGISKGSVAMWETNKRTPSTGTLVRLADLFGVTTDYLLGRTENPVPEQSANMPQDASRTANLISAFEQLDTDNQDIIIGEAKKLLKQQIRDELQSLPLKKKP